MLACCASAKNRRSRRSGEKKRRQRRARPGKIHGILVYIGGESKRDGGLSPLFFSELDDPRVYREGRKEGEGEGRNYFPAGVYTVVIAATASSSSSSYTPKFQPFNFRCYDNSRQYFKQGLRARTRTAFSISLSRARFQVLRVALSLPMRGRRHLHPQSAARDSLAFSLFSLSLSLSLSLFVARWFFISGPGFVITRAEAAGETHLVLFCFESSSLPL